MPLSMPIPVIIMGQANRHAPDQPEMEALYRLRKRFDDRGSSVGPYLRQIQPATKVFFDALGLPGVSIIGLPGFQWDSPLNMAGGITGVELTGEQTRLGETNTFVRTLHVADPDRLRRDVPLRLAEFGMAATQTTIPPGVTLPGPYTLARYSRLPAEHSNPKGFWQLVMKYAEILNEEVRDLQRAGAALVRIDELESIDCYDDLEKHLQALQVLTLQTDFKRVALRLNAKAFSVELPSFITARNFFNLPFSTFFLDFVKNPQPDILSEFPEHKTLVAGIMDGEEAYVEDEEELQAMTRAIHGYVSRGCLALSLNTDLQYLPWGIGLQKVKRLAEFADTFNPDKIWSPLNHLKRSFPKPTLADKPMTKESLIRIGAEEVARARKLHFHDAPFPVSSVGSFPQTNALRQARKQFRSNLFTAEKYAETALQETYRAMRHQEELGFAVATSGECFRPDMAEWFGENMGGMVDYRNRLPSMENLRYVPVVYGELIPPQPTGLLVKELKAIAPLTEMPVKVTVTGPATLAAWGLRQHPTYYRDSFRLRMDLAERLANEVRLLVDDGTTRIIQVDEPALTARREDFASDLAALEHCIAPFAHRVYLILHVCYSDPTTLRDLWPHILRLPVHQVHLEFANRGRAFLPLAEMIAESGKDIGLGVLDVHKERIETAEEIITAVESVLPYFANDGRRVHILPDCGQKAQSWEITKKKNGQMVLAAQVLREKYAKS